MSALLPVRVTVLDTWDQIPLDLPPSLSITELKRLALAQAGVPASPEQYLVKYRGAELYENGATLADAGIVPNAALIVLHRRRQPVR